MGFFKTVKVGRHPRRRKTGRVEWVTRHYRRRNRVRWKVIADDIFSGLGRLVDSVSGVTRALLLGLYALAAVIYGVVAGLVLLFSKKSRRKVVRRKVRRAKRIGTTRIRFSEAAYARSWRQIKRGERYLHGPKRR